MSNSPHRSFERITEADLLWVTMLSFECIENMLSRGSTGKFYSCSDNLLAACLVQGAARHFVKWDTGVQDWDVLFFFKLGEKPFPYRWVGNADYGPSKFGRNPDDPEYYTGRRIDVLGRDIPKLGDIEESIQYYLRVQKTTSAHFWSLRPVIALHPRKLFGVTLWDGS